MIIENGETFVFVAKKRSAEVIGRISLAILKVSIIMQVIEVKVDTSV